jgi:hypothetical protein
MSINPCNMLMISPARQNATALRRHHDNRLARKIELAASTAPTADNP